MRKKTLTFAFDTIFWYAIYLLPILAYLVVLKTTNLSFTDWMLSWDLYPTSMLLSSLNELFADNGILPLFSIPNSGFVLFSAWFIITNIVHLFVDFILFIPRLCHKYMHILTRDE